MTGRAFLLTLAVNLVYSENSRPFATIRDGHPRRLRKYSGRGYTEGRAIGKHDCGKVCIYTPLQAEIWQQRQILPDCNTHRHISTREANTLTAEYLYSERRSRKMYHFYTAYWLNEVKRPRAIVFNSAPRHWQPVFSAGVNVLQLITD